jgi:hypothetical protein
MTEDSPSEESPGEPLGQQTDPGDDLEPQGDPTEDPLPPENDRDPPPQEEDRDPEVSENEASDRAANSQTQSLSQRLLAGDDPSIVPPEQISAVVKYLSRYRDSHIDSNDVDEAERSDKLVREIAKRKSDSTIHSLREDRDLRMAHLLEAAQHRLANLEQRYTARHQALLQANDNHLRQLADRHQRECDDFAISWSQPPRTRPYTRASNQLVNLRTQSILLMKARRYDDYRMAERALDTLEHTEAAERHWKMETEFGAQWKILEDKQNEELNRQKVSNESHLCAFTRARDRELFAARQRVLNLENEIKTLEESEKMRNNPHYDPATVILQAKGAPRSAMDMKEICCLKLPPLNAKSRGQAAKSTPERRRS